MKINKQASLRQALIPLYDNTLLNVDRLNELQNLQRKGRWFQFKQTMPNLLTIGIICLMAVFGVKELNAFDRYQFTLEVFNHQLTYNNEEVQTSDFAILSKYFSKFNLSIQPLETALAEEWLLVGGRKCYINNMPAAHIFIKNKKTDEIESMYQASKSNYSEFSSLKNSHYLRTFGNKSVKVFINSPLIIAMTNSI